MLIIRKEQMDVLRDAALRRYKNTLYTKMLELRKAHAEAFPLISDADLAHRISDFVDDARSLDLKSQRDIALFVSLRHQCAMRMGVSFETSDISIPNRVRKCTNQYGSYADHRSGKVSGHVLAAQELANWIAASGTFPAHTTAISEAEVDGRTGIIFFLNGWGTTDHIDVWNGTTLKGGSPDYFDTDYDALWFWEIY